MQAWLLCLIGFFTLVACKVQIDWKKTPKTCTSFKDEDLFCNKTLFMETFVKNSTCIDTVALEKHLWDFDYNGKSSCKKKVTACSRYGDYMFTQTFATLAGQVIVGIDIKTKPTECWGYFYKYTYGNERRFAYISFDDNVTSVPPIQRYTIKPNTKITVRMASIPGFFNLKQTFQEFDDCGAETFQLAVKAMNACKAKRIVRVQYIDHWTRDACTYYPNLEDRKQIFLQMGKTCPQSIPIPPTTATTMNLSAQTTDATPTSDFNNAIYGAIAVALFTFLALGAYMYTRRKRGFTLFYRKRQEVAEMDYTDSHSVLILHRPGCELLDVFVRDVAFALSMYQIDVKLSLLEKSTIENEGGMARYIEKNIQTCDHVCIVISEVDQDPPLLAHKPYQVAMQLLNGLTFHTNDAPKCLPVYLAPYTQAVRWFPSVILTSKNRGFQLPQDIRLFIKFLLSQNGQELDKTKEDCLKVVYKRMDTLSVRILKPSHTECLADRCNKGERSVSRSNLSSLWPSSLPSAHSYASIKAVLDIEGGRVHQTGLFRPFYCNEEQYLWRNRCHSFDRVVSRIYEEERREK